MSRNIKIGQMITQEEFNKAIDIIYKYQEQIKQEYKKALVVKDLMYKKSDDMCNAELSIRTLNILRASEIKTIDQLMRLDIDKFRFRGLGNKTKLEIKEFQAKILIVD